MPQHSVLIRPQPQMKRAPPKILEVSLKESSQYRLTLWLFRRWDGKVIGPKWPYRFYADDDECAWKEIAIVLNIPYPVVRRKFYAHGGHALHCLERTGERRLLLDW